MMQSVIFKMRNVTITVLFASACVYPVLTSNMCPTVRLNIRLDVDINYN